MGKVIVITNRKGGCGKTMTAASLGIGLSRQGKKTLIIDADSQHSLTIGLGVKEPDKLPVTLATVMNNIINETDFDSKLGIIHHPEGVDLLPANNLLTGIELALAPLIGRETVLRQYVDMVEPLYDFILIDTPPTLDLPSIESFGLICRRTCAILFNSSSSPFASRNLGTTGMITLPAAASAFTVGTLLTMVDRRANFTRDVISLVERTYGGNIRIFSEHIPHSVRASESTAQGISIFSHDPYGKVAAAYTALTWEVLSCG